MARALLEAVFTLRFASYRLRGTTQAPATPGRQVLRCELAPASPPPLGSVLLLSPPARPRPRRGSGRVPRSWAGSSPSMRRPCRTRSAPRLLAELPVGHGQEEGVEVRGPCRVPATRTSPGLDGGLPVARAVVGHAQRVPYCRRSCGLSPAARSANRTAKLRSQRSRTEGWTPVARQGRSKGTPRCRRSVRSRGAKASSEPSRSPAFARKRARAGARFGRPYATETRRSPAQRDRSGADRGLGVRGQCQAEIGQGLAVIRVLAVENEEGPRLLQDRDGLQRLPATDQQIAQPVESVVSLISLVQSLQVALGPFEPGQDAAVQPPVSADRPWLRRRPPYRMATSMIRTQSSIRSGCSRATCS